MRAKVKVSLSTNVWLYNGKGWTSTYPLNEQDDNININNPSANYPQPIRFGGMGRDVNESGFSDHYPISVSVREK